MTSDQAVDLMMAWFMVREGLKSGDGTEWWGALRGVFNQIGAVYAVDYMLYAANDYPIQGVYRPDVSDAFRKECREYLTNLRR